ncbi:MCE family protein [Affinibrenneria salicis]|uniref:MCE family protein n=1 Tax=Affinibrenneria salicis TaxID=2590031 RepID=A0A5J5G360_9GAMM|nr:MlaD family protein [Affinibrenneria salicis]KAA9001347.1 MCE family protein [Affinibrenneria salicis]
MKYPHPDDPALSGRNWRNALIWLVPVIALLIGLSMLIQARLSSGPEITISFNNAAGLEAGKTAVKYKDVTVGIVKDITLSRNNSRVLVKVRLSKSAKNLTRADTRFWVVRPRVGISGVSGIDTLLSGAYIGVDRGEAKENSNAFTGLEVPPAVIGGSPGSQFIIEADDLGSLDIGSPIYYRRVQVGRVASYHLREDGTCVSLRVFIDAPYDRLVTADTRFWNVSGVDLSVGTGGFRLKTQTVAAIMAGGIAFLTPENSAASPQRMPAKYMLAADQDSAMAPPDGPAILFRLRFERSLRGLDIGAPVEFSSVRVGRVKSIELDYNPAGYRFPTIVSIEVYPSRMGHVLEKLPQPAGDIAQATAIFTRDLVENGLRAQAMPSSLLTGQLYISLDFIPDAPRARFDLNARPLLLPTVNGGLDKIQEQLASIVKKIDGMPLASIGNNLDGSLAELNKTLRMVNKQTLPAANRLMAQTQQTTERAQDLLAEDSPLLINLMQTLQEAGRTLRAVRGVTDQLSRHPESLLQGRPADPASTHSANHTGYPAGDR